MELLPSQLDVFIFLAALVFSPLISSSFLWALIFPMGCVGHVTRRLDMVSICCQSSGVLAG